MLQRIIAQLSVSIHLKPGIDYQEFLRCWLKDNEDITWGVLPSATNPILVAP